MDTIPRTVKTEELGFQGIDLFSHLLYKLESKNIRFQLIKMFILFRGEKIVGVSFFSEEVLVK